MNTEKTIEFIKKSSALKRGQFKMWPCFIMSLFMSFVVCIATESYAKIMFVFSIITSIIVIAVNFWFFVIRKKSLKYNLLLGMVIILDYIFPLFYLICISYYEMFGFKYLVLLFLLPFLITTLLLFWIGIIFMERKMPVKAKTKTFAAILSSISGGLAILISRNVNDFLSITVSENLHFLLIAYPFMLLVGLIFAAVPFDLLRYYYYTKLEKMGLVTEDILKPEQ